MSLVGRLEDLSLSDIFQILSVGGKTGSLILKGSRGNAFIVFKNGLVVRAEVDKFDKTIADDMIEAGIIKDTVYKMALDVKKKLSDKSIAEILYELGSVKKETLEKVTRKRIEKVICELLLWEDGDFQFELDNIDPKGKFDITDIGWQLSKGMSPEYLLVEGARVYDETSRPGFISTEDITTELGKDEEKEGEWEEDWGLQQQPVRRDILSLKSLTQELRFPTATSEITLLILRFASEIFERGILFIAGDKEIVGLGQFGLEIDRADETIREVRLPIGENNFLNKIITEKRPYKGEMERDKVIEELMKKTGGKWPNEAAFFPVIAEGRVVAMLYCDNVTTGEKIGETEGLEIFVDQAGLALEKSLLQRRLQEMEKKTI